MYTNETKEKRVEWSGNGTTLLKGFYTFHDVGLYQILNLRCII